MDKINVRVLTRPIELPEDDEDLIRIRGILQESFDRYTEGSKKINVMDVCDNKMVCETLSELLTDEIGSKIKVQCVYQNYDILMYEYSVTVGVIMDLDTHNALKNKNEFMDLFTEVINGDMG